MKDGLFHRQIGFPTGATVLFLGTLDLDYGPHSVKEASVDRYGEVALPSTVTVQQADVVEVSIERGGTGEGAPAAAPGRPPGHLYSGLNTPPGAGFR